jgi:Domain of unknown function (DUF4280)
MAGFLVNVGATVQCPHNAQATLAANQKRVRVGGEPVATVKAVGDVARGLCPFKVGTKPQPCVAVEWTVGARRVRIGGQAALLEDSTGLCKIDGNAPQVPPNAPKVQTTQKRVKGV